MSLVEAVANVVVGYGIAVLTQLVVFPWFGLPAHLDDALALGCIFTLVSLIRSFALRRLFERLRRPVTSGWPEPAGAGSLRSWRKAGSTSRSATTDRW